MNITERPTGHSASQSWPGPRPWETSPIGAPRSNADEKRSSPRTGHSGPIWWKEGLRGDPTFGWMLERSRMGAAFIVRGKSIPLAGTRIQTSDQDGTKSQEFVREAFVRRVDAIHADLYLVAVQFADAPLSTSA